MDMDWNFIDAWARRALSANTTAVAHGFKRTFEEFPTSIALIHSEVTEALEAWREPGAHFPSNTAHTKERMAEELADVVIRIMDTDVAYGLGVGPAIVAKMAINEGRPHMHGGKAI